MIVSLNSTIKNEHKPTILNGNEELKEFSHYEGIFQQNVKNEIN